MASREVTKRKGNATRKPNPKYSPNRKIAKINIGPDATNFTHGFSLTKIKKKQIVNEIIARDIKKSKFGLTGKAMYIMKDNIPKRNRIWNEMLKAEKLRLFSDVSMFIFNKPQFIYISK
jgi:hypothetical protein